MKKSPLKIYNTGDKYGEFFNLNSPYMLTIEDCRMDSQHLYHSMISPGYINNRDWSLKNVYSPDMRPLHRHDSIEFMYVKKGEITQYIEDSKRKYLEGDCCILNKNIRHVESFSSDFEAVFFLLSDKFISDALSELFYYDEHLHRHNTNISIYKELYDFSRGNLTYKKEYWDYIALHNKPTDDNQIKNIIDTIINETKLQAPGFYKIVSGNLARLLSLLSDVDNYRHLKADLNISNEDYIFNRVTIYLEQNNGRIDYNELETLIGYTRDYLNRIIKKRTGVSLTKYGHKICIKKAAFYLAQTDKSINEIIHLLGYTNRTYFNRIFTMEYEITPSLYRKNMKHFKVE